MIWMSLRSRACLSNLSRLARAARSSSAERFLSTQSSLPSSSLGSVIEVLTPQDNYTPDLATRLHTIIAAAASRTAARTRFSPLCRTRLHTIIAAAASRTAARTRFSPLCRTWPNVARKPGRVPAACRSRSRFVVPQFFSPAWLDQWFPTGRIRPGGKVAGLKSGLAFLKETIDPVGQSGSRGCSDTDHQASRETGGYAPGGEFQNANSGTAGASDTGTDTGDRSRLSRLLFIFRHCLLMVAQSDATRRDFHLTGRILRRLYIMKSEDGVICRFGRASEMCFAASV